MSLLELQRQNLIVDFCLENPNKSKSKTVKDLKLLGFKIPTIYRKIKRFEKQEKVKRKIGSGKKCALSSSKVRAALKKQTAGRSAKSYIERKSTKRPTDTADRKFLGELEKDDLQQELSSKRCKLLHGNDHKRAEVH
jgi:hypothetical protein